MLKKCNICGEKFYSKRKNKIYCSKECSKINNKKYQQKYKEKYKENIKQQTKGYRKEYKDNKKEYDRVRYKNNSTYYKKYQKEYNKNFQEKIKKHKKEYRQNHKNHIKEHDNKYRKTLNGRYIRLKAIKKYQKTFKGIVTRKRSKSKRRELGFNPLNEWFQNSEAHHINKEDVIYIPINYHFKGHSVLRNRNMEPINTVAFFFLMMQNINHFKLF